MEHTTPSLQLDTGIPPEITEEFLVVLREYGVVEASVFGSTVRDEAHPESDIDLLVRFETPATLFRQIELASALARVCQRPVDVLTDIHPAFRPYILPTLVRLPL